MAVLDALNWPVLRCPRLAGFEVSPEGEFRGFREKMAAGKQPLVRKSVMQYPDGPGLGLEFDEDWLRQHMAKGETWWG